MIIAVGYRSSEFVREIKILCTPIKKWKHKQRKYAFNNFILTLIYF